MNGKSSIRTIIINASAGSGKTEELSSEYMKILLSSNTPDTFTQILAVTFTNKAAREMKERVIGKLVEGALKGEEKHRAILESLLRNYRRVRIGTIDSFIRSVAVSSAGFLGLPPGFDIRFDLKDLTDYAIDRLLYDRSSLPLFMEAIEKSLKSLGLSTGLNPVHFLKRQISELMDKAYLEVERLEEGGGHIDEIVREIKTLAREMYLRYVEKFPGHSGEVENLLQKIENASPAELTGEFYIPTKDKRRKKHFQVEPDFYMDPQLNTALNRLLALRSALIGEMVLSGTNVFVKLLKAVKREMSRYLQSTGEELLTGVYQHLLEKLREMQFPSVMFALGEKLNHFLIDEFQDTNCEQWEILQEIIENPEFNTLFVVGDKKQAIYRWRGGDAGLFDKVRNRFENTSLEEKRLEYNWRSLREIVRFVGEYFSGNALKEALEVELNAQKDELMRQAIREAEGSWGFDGSVKQKVPQEKASGPPGYVTLREIEVENTGEGAEPIKEELLKLINEITERGWGYENITILVRERSDVQRITEWLSENGIPVSSQVTWDVRKHPAIREILSLLKFIENPQDDVNLSAFLTGELFTGVTGLREEIIHLLEERALRSRKKRGENIPPLYVEFRKKFPHLWEKHIAPFFALGPYRTPYELVSFLGSHFKEYFDHHPGAETFYAGFLEAVLKHISSGTTNLYEFLNWVETAPEESFTLSLPSYGNAVKVITAHSAKGLAFDIVIYPLGYFTKKTTELQDFNIVKDPRNSKKNNELQNFNIIWDKCNSHAMTIIGKISKKEAEKSEILKNIYTLEIGHKLVDEINLLYVTATRAKYELHIFKVKAKSSRIKSIPFKTDGEKLKEFGKPCRKDEIEESQEEGKIIYVPLYPDAETKFLNLVKVKKDPVIFHNEWLKTLRGELIHVALSKIEVLDESEWEKELIQVVKESAEEMHLESMLKEAESAIINFFSESSRRNLLSGRPVLIESPICTAEGNEMRPDRVQWNGNALEVIDFKTGEEEKSHKLQVQRYMKVLADILRPQEIRGYLAYIDLQKVVEVEP